MADRIRALIQQTEAWRRAYRAKGQRIEAAACAIRIRALEHALATFREAARGA